MKELKVGERITLEAVEQNGRRGCFFEDNPVCIKFACCEGVRSDGKSVMLEYIPGDLVYIHGSLRIISNCDGYYATYYDENESLQEVNVNVIEGIPITPEILEKNGWKNDGYDWYRLPTKRAYLYITKDITTLGEFLVCVGLDRHNLASVNFVHQLQHLLFGLGLNSEMEV